MRHLTIQQAELLSAAVREIKPRVLELLRDLSGIHGRTQQGDPWQPLQTIFALAADNHCDGYWTLNANQRHEAVQTALEDLCREGLLFESVDWTKAPIHVEYRYCADTESR